MANNDGFIDHYTVLGLPGGEDGAKLTVKDIETAYRRQAMILHPDKRRDDPMATTEFQRLVTSASVLRDESSRRLFDALLSAQALVAKNVQQSPMNEKDEKKDDSGSAQQSSVIGKDENKAESGGVQQRSVNKNDEEKAKQGGAEQSTVNEKDEKKGKQSQSGKATTRARSGRHSNNGRFHIFRKARDARNGCCYDSESSKAAQRTNCPYYPDFNSSWRNEERERKNLHSFSPNCGSHSEFYYLEAENFGHPIRRGKDKAGPSSNGGIGKGKAGASSNGGIRKGKGEGKAGASSNGEIRKGKGEGKAGASSNGSDATRKRDGADLDAKIEAIAKAMKQQAETMQTAAEALKKVADEIVRDVKRCKFDEPRKSAST